MSEDDRRILRYALSSLFIIGGLWLTGQSESVLIGFAVFYIAGYCYETIIDKLNAIKADIQELKDTH